jgi:hypothetical protein
MATVIDGREWVTLTEAAERLGLQYDSIRIRVRQHRIEGRYLNDRHRYVPWEAISVLGRKHNIPGRPAHVMHPDIALLFGEARHAFSRLEKALRKGPAEAVREAADDVKQRVDAVVHVYGA